MANRELSIILRLQDEASQSLKKFGANLEGLEPVFKKMTVIGTAAFAAMSGVVLKSTNDFALFEEQIQKAGGNIDATAKELEMFRKVAKDVGITTKFSATEAAEALFFLAGGAIDATEATAGLREAAKISATGELALKDAVILAGDAMTRFKIEAEDASRISDVLLYSTTRVQQTMPELDQAFKQVASTASQAGLSFEQTTGILNLFADSGKRGMEGGIALANILRNLTTNVVPEYETAITDLTKKKSGLSDKVKTTEDQLARLDLRMKNATSKTLPGLQLQYSQTQAKLAKYRSE
jgi:TP901 family phage tail tape measure protein